MDSYRDRMDVTAYRGREVCCTLYIADECEEGSVYLSLCMFWKLGR